jgi:hypothetical protein
MASLIIEFILRHWEDLLILIIGGVLVSLFDKFVLHKWHSTKGIRSSLAATDRLIAYIILLGSIISYIILQDTDNSTSFVSTFIPFFAIVLILIQQRSIGSKEKKQDIFKQPENSEIEQSESFKSKQNQ